MTNTKCTGSLTRPAFYIEFATGETKPVGDTVNVRETHKCNDCDSKRFPRKDGTFPSHKPTRG